MAETIRCADECKREIPADDIDLHGWQRLEITGRVRCLECRRALEAVNQLQVSAENGE